MPSIIVVQYNNWTREKIWLEGVFILCQIRFFQTNNDLVSNNNNWANILLQVTFPKKEKALYCKTSL